MKRALWALCLTICVAVTASAGGHERRTLGKYSGFENNEAELGAAVADAIKEISPSGDAKHDFTGREEMLGRYVAAAIKTLNANRVYQHEMNDALVKMTLNYIQFAKNNDMMDEIVNLEIETQFPLMSRVRQMIEKTGNRELALIAVTEQTACFYQLVDTTIREPGKLTYKSPFGTVLAQTRRLGMHDLTEQEIHEQWTVPRIRRSAEIMGVDLQISEWSDDGMITISVPENQLAAN